MLQDILGEEPAQFSAECRARVCRVEVQWHLAEPDPGLIVDLVTAARQDDLVIAGEKRPIRWTRSEDGQIASQTVFLEVRE